jgi:hypothetical protein
MPGFFQLKKKLKNIEIIFSHFSEALTFFVTCQDKKVKS